VKSTDYEVFHDTLHVYVISSSLDPNMLLRFLFSCTRNLCSPTGARG